jgi:isoleucyl-tRNA synthetase
MNVSSVNFISVGEAGASSTVTANAKIASGTKCDRCWRYTRDVGKDPDYPTVCLRCAEALHAIDFPPYAVTTNNLLEPA